MGEIKFRVWDKTQKIMLYPEYWDLYIALDGTIYEIEERYRGYEAYMYQKDVTENYELMRFTELYDQSYSHIEIWEGDIVRANGMHDDVIIYINGGFNLKGGDSSLNLKYQLDEYGNYEIIGNIYEHPHLIKK